jgi:hypothetical protein
MSAIVIRAGRKAHAHLQQHGLRARDIAVIPAAAGGPKGLIFKHLDQWVFGDWLPAAPRERMLVGASVGAWRMTAACHDDPVSAFDRLAELYCAQTYPPRPSPQYVTKTCIDFLDGMISGHEKEIVTHPHHRLHILASRGLALLKNPKRNLTASAGFGLAVLSNLVARRQLATHLARVIIGDAREPAFWLKAKFDAFDTQFAALDESNLRQALIASGTLPFIMEPVTAIAGAPAGTYWDGGLIDYHLALPYSRVAGNPEGGLVFYPHFNEHLVPGWFDKTLPWRRARSGLHREWLENVVVVAPSRAFLQTLTRGKLPDRNDFHYYAHQDELRIRNWKLAIGEAERMRDALAAFVEKPDMSIVKPL